MTPAILRPEVLPTTLLRAAATAATAIANPGAWPTVLALPAHRLYIVATPPGAPLMLTRVHLNGSVQTRVCRTWYETAAPAELQALAASHFPKVQAGLAGWPAIVAALHLTAWAAGLWFAGSILHDAVVTARQMLAGAEHGWTAWTWHLLLPLIPLAFARAVRFAMSAWLRHKLRQVAS